MEEDEFDYESLGANSTMGQNAIAGALAGIGEHCLMFPVDSIKTRMQVLATSETGVTTAKSVSAAANDLVRPGWLQSQKNLWRGVYSVVMGAGPAHALHFATYEFCKDAFGKYITIDPATSTATQENLRQLTVSGAAGACATFAHDALMTPFDVIKQRMQLKDSTYRSVRECARSVYAKEGLTAFYISFPTTLYMSIPFQSVQFATYEYCLGILNPAGQYNPKSHVVAGAIAGVLASSVTTPLDVIKTLLQTRGTSSDPRIRNCSGFWDAAKIIGGRYGYQGFFRGFKPRVLTHMPSTAISWSVYEYFKWFLSKDNDKPVSNS
ncbi:mitochondrial carrier domain-containing protein [Radiomyces spectabilis]|uniref:mitochondrial carrier domain-containing protein n=1 Tax=Radiomyces spectabilis TaxID=64574 RepID=UPI002220F6C5|nr:mitochondrial carrier domain-containing protein [Radiomyces spectabilis]KAI8376384.1 mitochondrial carrier domain-containing protein [Radiomyces spectabilis]